MNTVYLVKGEVTNPEAWQEQGYVAMLGNTEWQFSDAPPGQRTSSDDYLDLEEGLRNYSGYKIIFCE